MKSTLKLYVTTSVLAGVVGGPTAHAADSQSQIPTSGRRSPAPVRGEARLGTFKLADRIAAKVKAGAPS